MSVNFESGPFAKLKPELFWRHFYAITQIPHPSKSESGIADYAVEFAKAHNIEWKKDEVGNVLLSKAGTAGYENSPIVTLQAHMDMVPEKEPSIDFDFTKDPLRVVLNGDIVSAEGTTLGADNGVGVAAALAIFEDPDLEHPPLEAFFTMDEETGMTGAKNLSPDFLKGRRMLNLDSEEEGDIYIGCAGGIDNYLVFTPEFEKPKCADAVKVTIKGLKGGHSGIEINEGRANAIKLLGRFLWNLKTDGFHWGMASFIGGNKRNAIPREASAVLTCAADVDALQKAADTWRAVYADEFKNVEDNIQIIIERIPFNFDKILTEESAEKLLNAVFILHHGVVRMSHSIKDLVETSTNLAIIEMVDDKFKFHISHRSSSATVKNAISQRTEAFAKLLGFEYSKAEGYPGWEPNVESPLLKVGSKVYKEMFGDEIKVKAIHAGLECGLIMEKYPDLDAVSFGPTLKGVHTTEECVNVNSVANFYRFLTAYLKALK